MPREREWHRTCTTGSAMSRCLMSFAVLAYGTGCTHPDCEPPHVVTASASAEPGTVRIGAAFFAAFPALAPTSDGGVVCTTCLARLTRLDRDLTVQYEVDDASPPVAVGPDDTIYAIVSPGNLRADELAAFEPAGALRWHVPLSGSGALVPVTGGVYVDHSTAADVVGTEFFDAAHGERTAAFPGQRLLAADGDGLFTVTTAANTFDQLATLRHLDPAGAVTWERTWTTPTPGEGVFIEMAVAAPDGGMIIAGGAFDTVDLGDRMLPLAPDLTDLFLVSVDASGATRWAYRLPEFPLRRLAALPSGDVLLAGDFRARDLRELSDAVLAVATPTGIVRTYPIDGPADQVVNGLAASPDGLAWVLIANQGRDGENEAIMHIGGLEFRESATYVFSIVP
jgi:hypothetical protein